MLKKEKIRRLNSMNETKAKLREGWTQVCLGEIANVKNGKSNTQDAVSDGKYLFFDRSALVKRSSKFLFDTEAIILPGEGAEFIPKYFKGKFDLHQRAYSIVPNEKVDGVYLYYFLFAKRNLFIKKSVGSTVKSLRLPMIQAIPVLLPSLAEQKKIAEILSKVDEDIEKTDEVIKKTEKLKTGLLSEFFNFEVRHKKDDKVKLRDMTKSIQYGYTASAKTADTGVRYLRITDISGGKVKWEEVPFCQISNEKEIEKYKLKDGDIVFARTGASTGGSFLVSKPPLGVFASYLIRVQPSDNLNPKYLHYFFQSKNYWQQINSGISGSAQGGFNATKLANLKMVLLPLAEQNKISDSLSRVDKKIDIHEKIKSKLEILKKGLMRDLLSADKI